MKTKFHSYIPCGKNGIVPRSEAPTDLIATHINIWRGYFCIYLKICGLGAMHIQTDDIKKCVDKYKVDMSLVDKEDLNYALTLLP